MWSYYGAKTNIIDYYPKPKQGKIIEPFAGTARYALKYFDRDVLLVDKYEVIVKIWKWLRQCSEKDILMLPRMVKKGQTLNDFTFDCDEAKLLMGFLIKKGIERPAIKPTDWVTVHRPNFINFSLIRIAKNLFKIKHWDVKLGSYEDILNETATWFIDPPYKVGGKAYPHSNRKIDFHHLSQWCRSREGQVIVCEKVDAGWLDFKPLTIQYGSAGMQREGIWCNTPTVYDIIQPELFKSA